MPLVTTCRCRWPAAGAADLLGSRPTLVGRQALASHYFLLPLHVEIASLTLCVHGSLVAATLAGTSHSSLRSSQMD